jgi:transcriptional regulator with XRE-family HTH domain
VEPIARKHKSSPQLPRQNGPHTVQVEFREAGSADLVYNRLAAVLEHIQAYYFEGPSKLAADANVSRSALSRLVHGKSSPSYAVVCKVTAAIEKRLGRRIDPRDLVSIDGEHPTTSVCELCGCKGCLPECAYDESGNLKPCHRHLRPGKWTLKYSRLGKHLESTMTNGEED